MSARGVEAFEADERFCLESVGVRIAGLLKEIDEHFVVQEEGRC